MKICGFISAKLLVLCCFFFFFQAEDGIRDYKVTGVQTCALPISGAVATVSVNVADADGDPLVVVWTVDGTNYQTNLVPGGGPPTSARVDFTALFAEIGRASCRERV